ncbi:MAG: alpha/beta hydrolase [bacterium]|nr:alpha/beta hydrolase [bacterium]
MEEIDLGICGGQFFAGDSQRVGILLPGAGYLPAAPLLWFAREALLAQGWSVLQVWDRWDRSGEARQWVGDRFEAALEHVGNLSDRLLITKSLTSFALPNAVELGLPGIWLTPLLNQPEVRTALAASAASAAPTLAIGGSADPTWDPEFATGLTNVEVLEIEGADHGLQLPGDPLASIDALGLVTKTIGAFVGRVA